MSILEKGKEKKFKIKIVFAFKLSKKDADREPTNSPSRHDY